MGYPIAHPAQAIPEEAIRISEEARDPWVRSIVTGRVIKARQIKGDPFSEVRVSPTQPTHEEAEKMTPDDSVLPG